MVSGEEERSIPITTDSRTFEQRQKDLVTNLEREQQQVKQASQRINADSRALNDTRLRTASDWTGEVDHWLGETLSRWSDYMDRMERGIFTLVPMVDLDAHPVIRSGLFGHIPSIVQQMERQLRDVMRYVDDIQPELLRLGDPRASLVPRERRDGGALDYLKDAYEVGEDGKLRFKVKFDVRGFGPDDLKVSVSKNRLTVRGKKCRKTDTSSSSSEFCRIVYLPNSVDEEQFKCHITGDGVLMLDAPVKVSDYKSLTFGGKEPQLAVKPLAEGQLQLKVIGTTGPTVLDDGAGGKKLHVEVPVDTEFGSGDLSVYVGANRIVVSGRKQVIESTGASQCSHWKEFSRAYNAPETVDPLSVKSELHGNTLVVEASLVKLT